jgi:chaperonin GroES
VIFPRFQGDEMQVMEKVKTQLKPLNDFVLVRRLDEEESEVIAAPQIAKQKSDKGIVVAVGEGRFVGERIYPIDLQPGDLVFITKHGGMDVKVDGEELVLIRAGEVYGKYVHGFDTAT